MFGPNKDNFVRAINDLEPTTALLLKYNPEFTCTLVGAHTTLTEYPLTNSNADNGYAAVASGGFQWGNDPYKYPDNLPIVGAKGGPGGKPGCGSLPDAFDNAPVRQLVTNTGWGTGLDWRPNPGIGFPGWANYFPVTRAVPEPPSIRYPGGPAPGPAPATAGWTALRRSLVRTGRHPAVSRPAARRALEFASARSVKPAPRRRTGCG